MPFTNYASLCRASEVQELIGGVVTDVNAGLASVEQVKKHALLTKELEHEDGEVTATQKVKRAAIERQYAPLIDSLYPGREAPSA